MREKIIYFFSEGFFIIIFEKKTNLFKCDVVILYISHLREKTRAFLHISYNIHIKPINFLENLHN